MERPVPSAEASRRGEEASRTEALSLQMMIGDDDDDDDGHYLEGPGTSAGVPFEVL